MGTNSACTDARHESDDEVDKNMREIVKTIRDYQPGIHIILITPPPIREDKEFKDGSILREQTRIAAIAETIRGIEEPLVSICDLNRSLSERKSENWHDDDAHLSNEAEQIWADLLIRQLEATEI